MTAYLLLFLVFVATTAIAWILLPALADLGLERNAGGYLAGKGDNNQPVYRFTTPARLSQMRVSGAVTLATLSAALVFMAGVQSGWATGLVAAACGWLGFHMPARWIQMRIERRRMEFEAHLVDFLNGLAGAMRAGSDILGAIRRVSRDLAGPIGEEFTLLVHQHQFGLTLEESLQNLLRRMPSDDLRIMSTAIRVSGRTGGRLAEVLDRIAETIRERLDFAERLRTKTMQARFEAGVMASAPLWAFLILFFLDRDLMEPLYTTPQGWTGIGIAVGMEIAGLLFIRKIVRIES